MNKNLNYANLYLYTDVQPFEIIKRCTDRKMLIRKMNADLNPNWKPECNLGGFVCNVSNNTTQKYTYTINTNFPIVAMRLHKDNTWHSIHGKHIIEDGPSKFYDYNF